MNKFNLNAIAAERIAKISHKDIIALLFVAFISFLSYGQFAVDIAYNNDGIGRLFGYGGSSIFKLQPYFSGFTKGRWAYPFFVNLYNGMVSLPFFVTMVSVFLFVLTSVVTWKLFEIKSLSQKIITGGLLSSSPIFVHYFFYTGDGEVYATGILLITLGTYFFAQNQKSKNFAGILLSVIALACYPALFAYSMGLVCLYSLLLFFKEGTWKMFLMKTTKILLLSFFALAIYFIITKSMLVVMDLKMTSYRNADNISPFKLLMNFPKQFILTYYLFRDFWSNIHLVAKAYFVFSALSMVYVVLKKEVRQLPVLLTLFITAIPLAFIMYLITFENRSYEGFQYAFIPLLALLHVPLIRLKNTWIQNIILIVPVCLIFINMKTTNEIIMKYRVNCEASRLLTFNIANEVQGHPGYTASSKIAILGNISDNDNFKMSHYISGIKVLNGMNYPVGFSGSNVWYKLKNQMKLQGFDFEFASAEETSAANAFLESHDIPAFPKEGSVFEYNGIIVVNLGQKREIPTGH